MDKIIHREEVLPKLSSELLTAINTPNSVQNKYTDYASLSLTH